MPAGLDVSPKPGGCGELAVTALTLQRAGARTELYVAVKNEGRAPACSPAFSIELLDGSQQLLASGLGGLLVQSFYRLTDEAGNVAACVAPGDTAMTAIVDLPGDLPLADARQLVYFCNFWALEGEPLAGVRITDVRARPAGTGATFTGSLLNGFDVPLESPSVVVFPSRAAAGRWVSRAARAAPRCRRAAAGISKPALSPIRGRATPRTQPMVPEVKEPPCSPTYVPSRCC